MKRSKGGAEPMSDLVERATRVILQSGPRETDKREAARAIIEMVQAETPHKSALPHRKDSAK